MNWLKRELITGFQVLLTLGLDRQPAVDVIVAGTVPAWFDALTHGRQWIEEQDVPRIRSAFRSLAGSCRNWPAPRDLIDALPELPRSYHVAPVRISNDALHEKAMTSFADIAKKLGIPEQAA